MLLKTLQRADRNPLLFCHGCFDGTVLFVSTSKMEISLSLSSNVASKSVSTQLMSTEVIILWTAPVSMFVLPDTQPAVPSQNSSSLEFQCHILRIRLARIGHLVRRHQLREKRWRQYWLLWTIYFTFIIIWSLGWNFIHNYFYFCLL